MSTLFRDERNGRTVIQIIRPYLKEIRCKALMCFCLLFLLTSNYALLMDVEELHCIVYHFLYRGSFIAGSEGR